MLTKSAFLPACLFAIALAGAQEADPKAERVARIIEEIRAEHQGGNGRGGSRLIREDELNAYLDHLIKSEQPKELKSARVRLEGSRRFTAWLEVDFDQVDLGKGAGAGLLRTFLKGTRTVQVDGRLETSQGKGNYTVSEAWVGSVPIPASVANAALKSVGEKQTPPFDPTEEFRLPAGVESIEVLAGKVRVAY